MHTVHQNLDYPSLRTLFVLKRLDFAGDELSLWSLNVGEAAVPESVEVSSTVSENVETPVTLKLPIPAFPVTIKIISYRDIIRKVQ